MMSHIWFGLNDIEQMKQYIRNERLSVLFPGGTLPRRNWALTGSGQGTELL